MNTSTLAPTSTVVSATIDADGKPATPQPAASISADAATVNVRPLGKHPTPPRDPSYPEPWMP